MCKSSQGYSQCFDIVFGFPTNFQFFLSLDYNNMGGGGNMGIKNEYGSNMNQMGGGSGGGYGPPSGKQGGNSNYHPYRR